MIEYEIGGKREDVKDFIGKYFRKTFLIKKGDIELEVNLTKSKSVIKPKLDYYILKTIEQSTSGFVEYIFKICFYDPISKIPSFESVYINNISKSEKYSGSEIVNFVLDFLKSLKQVKNVYLYDGTEVHCKNSYDILDLSLYKLITSYSTFYQKFGFKLYTKKGDNIDKDMIELARKVSKYNVGKIFKDIEKIIKFIEKYRGDIMIKKVNLYDKLLEDIRISNYQDLLKKLVYLSYILEPYSRESFGNFLGILNDRECYKLSQFFDLFKYG